MVESKMIDKLRKLIKHQESAHAIGSIAEAEAFGAKIAQLLLENKLQMSDVDISEKEQVNINNEPVEKEIYQHKDRKMRRSTWRPQLANVVARAHFCRVLLHRANNDLTFIGTASDKAFAIYAYEVLADTAERIAEEQYRTLYYRAKRDGREYEMKSYKKNFFDGFVEAIKETYRKQRVSYEANPNALIVLNKSEEKLMRFYQRIPRQNAKSQSSASFNSMARENGYKAGSNASVNQGVTNGIGQKLIK